MTENFTDEDKIISQLHEARRRARQADAHAEAAHAEYYAAVRDTHAAGLSWQRIGDALGVTFGRARGLALKAERNSA